MISKSVLISLGILVLASCGRTKGENRRDRAAAGPVGASDTSIALIGDSVATGVFASTELGHWPKELRKYINRIFEKFGGNIDATKFAKEFTEYVPNKIGESESRLRAISTDEDWGLRQHVADMQDQKVSDIKYFLAARFGAGIANTDEFVQILKEQYAKEGQNFRPRYVVFMLGVNDFCRETPVEKIASNLDSALQEVVDLHPDSRIVVASMPPVLNMKDLQYEYDFKLEFKVEIKKAKAVSCDDFRREYCPSLYEKYAEERWNAINTVFEESVDNWKLKADMVLVKEISALAVKSEQMAFDCFHPNYEGQKKISAALARSLGK